MMRFGFVAFGLSVTLACCVSKPVAPSNPADLTYRGIETRLMEGDLVSFRVAIKGPASPKDIEDYATCAAAQYALIRNAGFARHVRTNVARSGNVTRGDAVWMISAALPIGHKTFDAEVVVRNCGELGIPTI